ncbi:16S rRNA (cytosine(1402)-N(4))-methyltransferase RsmH [Nesterenkonia halotolerans]|uniref:Ribosomal RNA small subunit methyltransferase H n=1 Tax=Nesterenkonia halotolerans TaxID=225325 RepID=A0ABR9J4R7_9MICC|nr:16S rRNA (cytosine(1402)-N(4))-methyltransferase RsmH [Nesterenkonia halotolerans]MBE1513969.1 16S rRNA (cytosine1402-N4)-methyltransferase [Nesterenkonia halotolerans]
MAQRETADRHVPVMRDRCIKLLTLGVENIRADGHRPVVIDATLGMGGHAEAMLEADGDVTVLGLDRDPQAHELAAARLAPYGDRFRGIHTVYDRVDEVAVEELQADQRVAGVLLDLGVSSLQLDEASRGFAYSYDAPLDMRMDASAESPDESVAELLAHIEAPELSRILREYGEERFAGRIAKAIVTRRETTPFTTTADLAAVVDRAVPAASKRTGGHPAKRTFQALRIAVNEELEVLGRTIPHAMDAVAPGGRIVAMSYHSLEDRIVKQAFARRTKSSAPAGLPVELEEHKPTFTSLTRGAELPDETEIAENPRAASAKLRAVEKLVDPRRTQA